VKIFFPVLNWGLGHASRSLPLIRKYTALGYEVLCASDGEALAMLRKELPDQMVLELPAYGIQYESKYMPFNMLKHGPRMLRTMWAEHNLTEAIVKRHQIDCIISDNRYGCYHDEIPSALITHQLQVFTGNKILDVYIRRQIRSWCRNFTELWIPDNPPRGNLTGEMAGIDTQPIPKYYLGFLSELTSVPSKGKFDAIAVISGPEPQRTHFEELVIRQLSKIEGNFAIVGGRPDLEGQIRQEGNLTIYPYMNRNELSALLSETTIIISRGGYTTLMDLATTGHKAIICPTPGQYEQIYLADRLANHHQGIYMRQENLDLGKALVDVQDMDPVGHGMKSVTMDFVGRLQQLVGMEHEEKPQDVSAM